MDVTVAVGHPLTVTLCANPATGFQWEPTKIENPTVVQQIDHQSEPPKSDTVGAPGTETWTFQALTPGTSTISLDYSRPWTGGEKAVWRLVLNVTAT